MKKLLLLGLLLVVGCPPSPPNPNTLPTFTPPVPAKTSITTDVDVAACVSGTAVVLVLDTSGSMEGDKRAAVKRITRETVAGQLGYYALGNALDVAIIECGGWGARVWLDMTAFDPGMFDAAVSGLSSHGGTPLAESLELALHELNKSALQEKHLFVLSDGQAHGVEGVFSAMEGRGLENVSIHLIGFQTDVDHYTPFKNAGAAILMADDDEALESSMALTFKGILKLEADD